MATLNVIFEDKNKKLTINGKMMRLEEQVTAFITSYNDYSNSKFLTASDIKEFNQYIKIQFYYNYNQIVQNEFFQKLPP